MQNVSALHWKFDRNSTILGNSWFDDSYVSSGFGNNFKTMWNGGDHGGSGSRPFVQTQAFADLMDAFYNGGTGGLVNQNGTLKWWTDYDDPDTSVKGVGALGMLKLTHKSPKSDDDNWAKAALGFMALDISVPDPSDAAWPKWAAYGVVAGTYLYLKMEKEIDKIESRDLKPKGFFISIRSYKIRFIS